MSIPTKTDSRQQSFAEAALRLSGKTEEEARRTGAVDRADDQIEALFAREYQTVNSPIHRAVWGREVPLELFSPPPLAPSAPYDAAMERSLDIVRRHRQNETVYDDQGKVAAGVLEELGRAGYWGMLI